MSDWRFTTLACVAIALLGAGAWFGSVLVKQGRVGVGVTVFLATALFAALVTDNMR